MRKKSIHFVGIKGVGMAPLAIISKEAGFTVSGCDIADEFITDAALKKAGITPLVGFSKEHLHNVDLVITTGAHGGFENPLPPPLHSKSRRSISKSDLAAVLLARFQRAPPLPPASSRGWAALLAFERASSAASRPASATQQRL